VNWLAVFFNSSFYREYPRTFKISELVRYGIDEWSICFAKRFPNDTEGWEDFLKGQCENSILRDICEAHLLFEELVDPNPWHLVESPVAIGDDDSKREFRLRRAGYLNSTEKFQIHDYVDVGELEQVREYVTWMTDAQTYLPHSRKTVSRLAEQFADYLLEITDKPHEGQLGSFELIDTFLLTFVRHYSAMFSNDFASRVEAIDESENVPHGFDKKAQWVFDEICFLNFEMVFNPTGLTHDVLRFNDPGWKGFGVYSANAVFAICELISKLPKPPFRQWLTDSSTVFNNGFSCLEEIGVSAELVLDKFQFFEENY
jgi:hypothetical protein